MAIYSVDIGHLIEWWSGLGSPHFYGHVMDEFIGKSQTPLSGRQTYILHLIPRLSLFLLLSVSKQRAIWIAHVM